MDLVYRTRWPDQGCINKLNIISIVMYVQNRVELWGDGCFCNLKLMQLKHQVFGTGCDMEHCRGRLAQVK